MVKEMNNNKLEQICKLMNYDFINRVSVFVDDDDYSLHVRISFNEIGKKICKKLLEDEFYRIIIK